MSLAFPEVRANQIQKFLESLDSQRGADGIQVELVLGNEDADGVSTYGYEDAVADAFQQEHGKSPFDIPNSDPDWLRFRARYVTAFLAGPERRRQGKESIRPVHHHDDRR